VAASHAVDNDYDDDGGEGFESQVKVGGDKDSREPAWVVWSSRILGYLAVAGLGFTLGYLAHERLWGPKIRTYEEILLPQLQKFDDLARQCEPELRSCAYRLGVIPGPLEPSTRPASPRTPGAKPAPSQMEKPPNSGKGSNGKH